jgi:hypothetical protein
MAGRESALNWAKKHLDPFTASAMEQADPGELERISKHSPGPNNTALRFAWERASECTDIRNEFLAYFYQFLDFNQLSSGPLGLTMDAGNSGFAAMLEGLPEFRDEANYRGVIQQKAEAKLMEYFQKAGEFSDPKGMPRDSLPPADGQEITQLMHAISHLKREDQDLLNEVYFGGKTIAELASEMGLKAAALRKRLERIRKKLRGYMDD